MVKSQNDLYIGTEGVSFKKNILTSTNLDKCTVKNIYFVKKLINVGVTFIKFVKN